MAFNLPQRAAARRSIGCIFALSAGGCAAPSRPRPTAPPVVVAPRSGASTAAKSGGAGATAITPRSAGPLSLGMTAEQVKKLPALTVQLVPASAQKDRGPGLLVSRFGVTLAIAELRDDRVTRIRVGTPDYATAEGAHVGMTARELAKLYGAGELMPGKGFGCVRFEKAPGLVFCFAAFKPTAGRASGGWANVALRNPRVRSIVLTDDSRAAG